MVDRQVKMCRKDAVYAFIVEAGETAYVREGSQTPWLHQRQEPFYAIASGCMRAISILQ